MDMSHGRLAEQVSLDTVTIIHWLVGGPAMYRSRGRVNTAGDLEGTGLSHISNASDSQSPRELGGPRARSGSSCVCSSESLSV